MDAKALFLEGFYVERANYAGFSSRDIRAGGKVSKANPNKEDELWWLANGPAMVQRWIDWRKQSDWEIWRTPDGKPGIELALEPMFGRHQVKMVIDRVFVTNTGARVVVDLKSGSRTPDSDLQLAFYAAGIQKIYDINVPYGAYWDARKGEMSQIQPIGRLTLPLITYWIDKYVEAKEHGVFLPHISNLCRACGVNRYCVAYGGKSADRDPDIKRAFNETNIPF